MSLKLKSILSTTLLSFVLIPTSQARLEAQSNINYGCACDAYSESGPETVNPLQLTLDSVSDLNNDGLLTVCVGDNSGSGKFLKMKNVTIRKDNVSICGGGPWTRLRNENRIGTADEQSGFILENAKNFSLKYVVVSTLGDNGNGLTVRSGEVALLDRVGFYPSGINGNGISLNNASKIKKIDTSQLYLDTTGDQSTTTNLYGAGIRALSGSSIDEIISTNFSFANYLNFGIVLDGATINYIENVSVGSYSNNTGGYGIYLANNSRISHIKGGEVGLRVDRNITTPYRVLGKVFKYSFGFLLHRSKIGLMEDISIGGESVGLYANESEIHQMKNVTLQTGNSSSYGLMLYKSKIGSLNGFKSGKFAVKYATTFGDIALSMTHSEIGLLNEFDLRGYSGLYPLAMMYDSKIDQLSNGRLYSSINKFISLIGASKINSRWKVHEYFSPSYIWP